MNLNQISIARETMRERLSGDLDQDLFHLVNQYLNISFLDSNGFQPDFLTNIMPPAGELTEVLHNFLFKELDDAVEKECPSLYYARHIYEIISAHPTTRKDNVPLQSPSAPVVDVDEHELPDLIEFIEKNNDTILPGDKAMKSNLGYISLDMSGRIQFIPFECINHPNP